MSEKFSNQTLRSLEEGDIIHILAFEEAEVPASFMKVDTVLEDCITGYTSFDGGASFEYAEIYEESWDLIYDISYGNW